MCLLQLVPPLYVSSAHYRCSCNERLRISSRTKSLPFVRHDRLSFQDPQLIVSEDEQLSTIKGVDHYFCCKGGWTWSFTARGETLAYLHLSSEDIMEGLGMGKEPANGHNAVHFRSVHAATAQAKDVGWDSKGGSLMKPMGMRLLIFFLKEHCSVLDKIQKALLGLWIIT